MGGIAIIKHEGWSEPELGWHIFEGFEGKGFAVEAALEIRRFAAREWGITAPISHIAADNERSIALAKRLGASFERVGEVVGHPCHIYRHPKTEAL